MTPSWQGATGWACAGMLTEANREEISRGIAEHAEGRVIAERIGRDRSLASHDIARHGGRTRYQAVVAGRSAMVSRCQPKIGKLDADPGLREQVLGKLRAGCSPDQVASGLCHEHGSSNAGHHGAQPVLPLSERGAPMRRGNPCWHGPECSNQPRECGSFLAMGYWRTWSSAGQRDQ